MQNVMIQAYERRVLTYVPTNPPTFQVEMGNIGQHYYDWRYKDLGKPTGNPAYVNTRHTRPDQHTWRSHFYARCDQYGRPLEYARPKQHTRYASHRYPYCHFDTQRNYPGRRDIHLGAHG